MHHLNIALVITLICKSCARSLQVICGIRVHGIVNAGHHLTAAHMGKMFFPERERKNTAGNHKVCRPVATS